MPNCFGLVEMFDGPPGPIDCTVAVGNVADVGIAFFFALGNLAGEDFAILGIG